MEYKKIVLIDASFSLEESKSGIEDILREDGISKHESLLFSFSNHSIKALDSIRDIEFKGSSAIWDIIGGFFKSSIYLALKERIKEIWILSDFQDTDSCSFNESLIQELFEDLRGEGTQVIEIKI